MSLGRRSSTGILCLFAPFLGIESQTSILPLREKGLAGDLSGPLFSLQVLKNAKSCEIVRNVLDSPFSSLIQSSADLNMRASQRRTMSGPEKLGNPAIPSPQVAGTGGDLAGDTQASTRIPQGFGKPTTRVPQGCHRYVARRSFGRHGGTTAEPRIPLGTAKNASLATSTGLPDNRPPRKYKHENTKQRRDAIRIRKTG